jgi:hypothetical protein
MLGYFSMLNAEGVVVISSYVPQSRQHWVWPMLVHGVKTRAPRGANFTIGSRNHVVQWHWKQRYLTAT